MRRFCLLVSLLIVCVGHAQSIRRRDFISSSSIRPTIEAAERQGLRGFPNLRTAEQGTIITTSSDFENLDILLFVGLRFPERDLLAVARRVAAGIGCPQADYIINTGRRLRYVDIELNKYQARNLWTSSYDLPIGRIQAIVEDSSVPRPIGVGIEVEKTSKPSFRGEKLRRPLALLGSSIEPGEFVTYRTERHWYGLVALAFMAIMFAATPIASIVLALRAKQTPPAPESTPKSLNEIQLKYAKSRVSRWLPAIVTAPTLVMPFAFFAMEDMFKWLSSTNPLYAVLFVIPSLACAPLVRLIRKRRNLLTDAEKAINLGKPFGVLAILVVGTAIEMGLVVSRPDWFTHLPRGLRLAVGLSPLALSAVCAIFFARYMASKDKTRLAPGDPDYDAASELARLSKVRLRSVSVNQALPGVNACATFGGRVVLSNGLREKLTAEERRAVIAHEIGHLKGNHVPFLVGINLLLIVLLVVVIGFAGQIRGVPDWVQSALDSPGAIYIPQFVVSIFLLSPFRRRAELSADRFALQATHDYGLVATALARVHLLNSSPHTFLASHERIASHPSLTKRLASLRAVAQQMGLPVDDSGVDQLMTGEKPPVPV